MDLQQKNKQQNAEEKIFLIEYLAFSQRVRQICQKDPSEMTLDEISFLQKGTERTSKECQCIVQNGGIDIFIRLLEHTQLNFVIEAFYGIGNIAHESSQIRQLIILKGGLDKLVIAVRTYENQLSSFELGIWALNNLCLDKLINIDHLKGAIRYFCQCIVSNKFSRQDILTNSMLCITNRKGLNRMESRIRSNIIVQTNLIPSLFHLLNHYNIEITNCAINILSDMSSGSYTRYLVDQNVIHLTYPLLFHQNLHIRTNVCLIYSNIAADLSLPPQLLLRDEQIVQSLFIIFKYDQSRARIEVGYIFANFLSRTQPKNIVQYLFKQLKICLFYAELLIKLSVQQSKQELLNYALTSLQRLLQGSQRPYLDRLINISECLFDFDLKGLLITFMSHSSRQVTKLSQQIIQKFF